MVIFFAILLVILCGVNYATNETKSTIMFCEQSCLYFDYIWSKHNIFCFTTDHQPEV